jgi:uncharacterized protein YtpQ (UPF0354 family)
MGTWILLGGGLLVVVALWAVYRWQRAPSNQALGEVSHFLLELLYEVRRHRDVEFRGTLPGAFAILVGVRGQEVPVALDQIYRHYRAFPSRLSEMVDYLLDEIEESALDHPEDHLFSAVAMSILPQVRRLSWVREHAPAFGDSALVHRPLGPDLALCYVIDDDWSMVFLCQAHLRQWCRTEEDMFQLARQNLVRRSTDVIPLPTEERSAVLLRSGDGYDAARVVLLDAGQLEGLLIAMPEQEVLWLGREAQHSLESLVAQNHEQNEHAPRPVSPELYRMQGDELVPVTAPRR